MPNPPPSPLCFVAMSSAAPDGVGLAIEGAIGKAGLEPVRADFASGGGFVDRSSFEALLVVDHAVVDITSAGPAIIYLIGLRDGAGRSTLLVGEAAALEGLRLDLRPGRVLPYQASALAELGAGLEERLKAAVAGSWPPEDTLLQITATRSGPVSHEKTDVFVHHLSALGPQAARVAELLRGEGAVDELRRLEAEVLSGAPALAQLFTALLAIYLGYRARKAWPDMVSLYQKMPRELQESAVAREQLALAQNRIAEGLDADAAHEVRRKAIAALEGLSRERWTSETFAILGRIHKGQSDAESRAAELAPERAVQARAALSAAIKAYEDGFKADPRDYYPGVNAVTLRILRRGSEDEAALGMLLPIVRFAVNRAPAPLGRDEAYWQGATRLELAAAGRDWSAAQFALEALLKVPVDPWMRQTTVANLQRQAEARAAEPDAQRELASYIGALGAPAG